MISGELQQKIQRLRELFSTLDETEREIEELLRSVQFPFGYEFKEEFENKKATKQLHKNQLVTADDVEDVELPPVGVDEDESEDAEPEEPKPRKTRKPTTCSHCGTEGHTNRTCPEKDTESPAFPTKHGEDEEGEYDEDDEIPAKAFSDDD